MSQVNLDGDVLQNIRSDTTQGVLSETVKSLNCRPLDMDKTLSEVENLRIENITVTTDGQPSRDRKRVKKPPKTRSEDFLWT
jgi:tRNA uridine 5-carbamoylmethylation protein Kti12